VNEDDPIVLDLGVAWICDAEFMPKRANPATPYNSLKSNRIVLLKKKANWVREVTKLYLLTKMCMQIPINKGLHLI